jgi:hypothetical protein
VISALDVYINVENWEPKFIEGTINAYVGDVPAEGMVIREPLPTVVNNVVMFVPKVVVGVYHKTSDILGCAVLVIPALGTVVESVLRYEPKLIDVVVKPKGAGIGILRRS